MLPGAILGAVVLVGTLQALPLFVVLTSEVVALQALGTTFLLLVWLYVMANVIVFGAALNYVLAYGVTGREVQPKRPSRRPPTRHSRRAPGPRGPELPCERGGRLRAVGVGALPLVAEHGDRAALPVRHEDGVEAEACASRRGGGDRPIERARGDDLAPSGAIATSTQT